jgi:hypothetical protein
MKNDMAQDKKTVKKAVGMHDKQMHGGKKTDLTKLKKGGMAKGYEAGGSIKPAVKKETMTSDMKDKLQDAKNKKAAENYAKTRKFAKGGGIESRGKTRGKGC